MSEDRNPTPNFRGMTVAAFESRRAEEMAALISNFGGQYKEDVYGQVAPERLGGL
jgi:hypothetical protein